MVSLELTPFAARQVAHAEDGIGKAPRDALGGTIDEPDQGRQTPARRRFSVIRHDAEVRRGSEAFADVEPALVWTADRKRRRCRGLCRALGRRRNRTGSTVRADQGAESRNPYQAHALALTEER